MVSDPSQRFSDFDPALTGPSNAAGDTQPRVAETMDKSSFPTDDLNQLLNILPPPWGKN
jgi:hypothetical protein